MSARRLFATVLALIGALVGCGDGAPSPGDAGYRVWQAQGCAGCHGEPGVTRSTAPPLVGLAAHWDRDSLVEYLADPEAVKARTPRLQYLNERYPVIMPQIDASTEDLQLLADHLMSR